MNEIRTAIILDDSGFQDAAKRVIDSTAGIVDSQRKVKPATAGSARAFENLRRSLDPAYDAQKRLEKATRDADAAIRAGKASIEDKVRVLDQLRAKTDPATSSMFRFGQSIGQDLNRRMTGLGGGLGAIGNAMMALGPAGVAAAAGIGGIAAAVAGAASQLRANAQYFGELNDQAARLDLRVDAFQELAGGMADAGIDAGSLTTALDRLADVIGNARLGEEAALKTLDKAGISLVTVERAGGDTSAALAVLADRLREADGSAQRTAIAHDLLGKSGSALLPILTQGSDGLAKLTAEAERSGQVLGVQTVAAYDDLGDALDQLGRQARVASGEIFAPLISGAQATVEEFGRLVTKTGQLAAAVRNSDWNAALRLTQGKEPWGTTDTSGSWGSPADDMLQMQQGLLPRGPAALQMKLVEPVTATGGGRGGARAAREPSLGLEMGKPFGNQLLLSTGGGLDEVKTSVVEPSYSFKQHAAEADDFYKRLDEISKKTEENTTKSKEWYDQITLNTIGINQAAGTLGSALADVVTGEMKVSQLLEQMPEMITKIIVQKIVELTITRAIAAATGGIGGIGGAIGGLIGSLFGGGGGGGFEMGSFQTTALNAHGNVYDAGNVIPFARGGIVDRPTLFRFAQGTGLMGEAGPEAVLPLRRTPSGDLGVRAGGGPSVVNNVTVINRSGAKVTTEEQDNGRGGKDLVVLIDAVEREMASRMTRPGTTLNKAYRSAADPVRAR